MRASREKLLNDERSFLVAGHTLSSLLLETLADLGYTCTSTPAKLAGRYGTVRLRCRRRPSLDELEEAKRYIRGRTGISLEVEYTEEEGYGIGEHLRSASNTFLNMAREALLPLLGSRHEHALVVLWDGTALILPGGQSSIRIPGSVYAAIAHTHPSGLCLPSHYDIRSIADRLADGECCEAIISPSCIFMASRRDTLALDDYDALLHLSHELSKAKALDKYLEKLSLYSHKLRTVKLSLRSL